MTKMLTVFVYQFKQVVDFFKTKEKQKLSP